MRPDGRCIWKAYRWPVGFKCGEPFACAHPSLQTSSQGRYPQPPEAVQNQVWLPAASFLYNWGNHLYNYKTKWLSQFLSFLRKKNLVFIHICGKLQFWPRMTLLCSFYWFYFSPKMAHIVLITLHQYLGELVLKKLSIPSRCQTC